jgi:hypothetical protein
MAPQEVAGLQALAKAHGGSLTTNPDTGLPEAGFLRSILPMVIGAGLAATGVGAPLAAAMVGGGYGVATGSLKKGLMAGLGAYGGAGLAGGLMGAGAAGAAELGAAGAMGPQTAAQLGTGFESAMAAQGAAPTFGATGASMGAQTAGQLGAGFQADMAAQGIQPSAIQAQQAVQAAAPQTVTKMAPTFSDNLSQMGRGVQSLGAEQGRDAFMKGVGGGSGLLKYGYAAGLPMLMQDSDKQAEKETEYPEYYSFDAGRLSERSPSGNYFNPTLTRIPRKAAGGGLMDIGPVQAMSDRNEARTLMANGGQMFAEGGETKAVKSVDKDPYYTMSGQSGDVFKYLMGQGANPMTAARNAPAPTQMPAPTAAPTQTASGGQSANAGVQNYSFDPATGRLVALPVIAPTVAPTVAGGSGTGFYDPSGYGYGDSGPGPGPSDASTGPGGGMSNSGEGGPDGVGGWANGGIASFARGGPSHLGDYSDGGRLLKGPGDGVSDSIPATIANKRPARLADGEFVVPARIVSELGNGSTEAGARKLYAMMDRVQNARKKSIGKNRVAVNSRSEKMLPA